MFPSITQWSPNHETESAKLFQSSWWNFISWQNKKKVYKFNIQQQNLFEALEKRSYQKIWINEMFKSATLNGKSIYQEPSLK